MLLLCRYNLYGSSRRDQAVIDQTVDAVEDLQLKYLGLVYGAKLADDAKATYWSTHGDPENKTVGDPPPTTLPFPLPSLAHPQDYVALALIRDCLVSYSHRRRFSGQVGQMR